MVLSPSTRLHEPTLNLETSQKISRMLPLASPPTLSFEYFPPKTELGLENLYSRLHSMKNMNPVWIDVTFGAGGSTTERTLEICRKALKHGLNVMMHLTCTNMRVEEVEKILEQIKEAGIRNILALRGDPPVDSPSWKPCDGGFEHAVDLVRFIKEKYGDYFCIGVAGYPEGHADSESAEKDLEYLRDKVNAGADMIVTQLFYDVEAFFTFVEKARALGITIPIFPGIMPILSSSGLMRMTSMCKVRVPNFVTVAVDQVKDEDQKVREYGIHLAAEMCEALIERGVPGIHIYTMNNEDNVRQIVKRISHLLPENHIEWISN